MSNTKYYTKYNSKYTNSGYAFSFLHNSKLKTEVLKTIPDGWVKLNKFRVTGLLHFHKATLPSHLAEFPFQNLQYVYENTIYFIREKDWCIGIKYDDKEFIQFK